MNFSVVFVGSILFYIFKVDVISASVIRIFSEIQEIFFNAAFASVMLPLSTCEEIHFLIFRDFPIRNAAADQCVKHEIANALFSHCFAKPLHIQLFITKKYTARIHGKHV